MVPKKEGWIAPSQAKTWLSKMSILLLLFSGGISLFHRFCLPAPVSPNTRTTCHPSRATPQARSFRLGVGTVTCTIVSYILIFTEDFLMWKCMLPPQKRQVSRPKGIKNKADTESRSLTRSRGSPDGVKVCGFIFI